MRQKYLKEKLCIVETPEADNCKKKNGCSCNDGREKSSWVVTCKRLLEDNIRVHLVKSYKKYSKEGRKKERKRWKI